MAHVRTLVGRAEADRLALGAGARGAADAVDILLGNVRNLEVDHMADARHIDTACGDVGRDEQLDLARTESLQRVGTLRLDRKSTRLNYSHSCASRMLSSA